MSILSMLDCTSRFRQELSNEYFLAKFGVDTAENEPLKVLLLSFLVLIPSRDLIFTKVPMPAPPATPAPAPALPSYQVSLIIRL